MIEINQKNQSGSCDQSELQKPIDPCMDPGSRSYLEQDIDL